MFKKKLCAGLILLLMLALGGCQTGGIAKDVVYSQKQKSADGIDTASRYTASVQQAEAVEKARAAFKKYFNIQTIDKGLALKAVLIEDDGILWMNPYWKLSWLGKDAQKPIYSAEIDAQSGEVVQLHYRPNWGHKNISQEDVLAYQDTALAFIDKFALVKEAPLSIFEASSSYVEGISVEFRYGPGKFITLYLNKAGDVTGFKFAQQIAYTLQGNDLKIDRAQAITMAQASIKQYYGEVDTSGLIDQVGLFEGNKGEKTWFVYWKNVALLEGRYIRYGAQIDALSGKVCAVEGINHALNKTAPKISEEKRREIADRFLQQKNLSDYRFEAFDKDLGALCYQNQAGSPLQVHVDQTNGEVCYLYFVELK